jgi:hypothetical protein
MQKLIAFLGGFDTYNVEHRVRVFIERDKNKYSLLQDIYFPCKKSDKAGLGARMPG